MSWMSMYPEAKAITPVSPALLPSKIAAVMQVPSHHYERTLFFGDAGGAIHAEGTLATIPDPADASQNKIFFQFIRHDQETISIPMRDEVYHAEKTFFVLKYLPHGQVIHNSLNTGPIN